MSEQEIMCIKHGGAEIRPAPESVYCDRTLHCLTLAPPLVSVSFRYYSAIVNYLLLNISSPLAFSD